MAALILFGGGGDLAMRMLLPSLYFLDHDGLLPDDLKIIGAARSQETAEDYIAKVRRKLDLDQRQAAELFGGGVNAFSRYENGKTKPPLALVKLFKLLDRHPDLLNEVRSA